MKFCGQCGCQLPDEALFCAECGNRVAQDISNENPVRNSGTYIPNNIPPAQGQEQEPLTWVPVMLGAVIGLGIVAFVFLMVFYLS